LLTAFAGIIPECLILREIGETLSVFNLFGSLNGFKKSDTHMILITDKAKHKISELLQTEGKPEGSNIRVSVKGGGCSGLMYDLDFDTEIKPADQIFEDKGVKILVDKKSLLYLLGTTLDFSDGLNGKGFQFINPNATRTCGCGESFAV
jgi:iron-sulfur cluster assembly protein